MTLLKGLKILDFSWLLPGPFATLILTDLGAEVLKVEKPTDQEPYDLDRYVNRSKKSITLDLKKQDSISIIKKLVKEYDIVLEQFRPGVMEKLGLGYKDLKEENPSLIYCSLTGFGQTGSLKNRPGHDINYLALAGLASYSGTKSIGPAPQGTQIADIAGGSLYTAIGILSAVVYRDRTGLGQKLDISMTDCVFTLNALAASSYLTRGENPEPEKMLLNGGTFYGYYETKDGRYFSVGSLEPKFRKALCEGIGCSDLLELSMSNEPDHVQTFKRVLRDTFLTKTFSEWQDVFAELEACVEPVLTLAEACELPHIKERNMIVEVPVLDGGYEKQIGCPIKSSVYTPDYKYVGLKPGESNTEIIGILSQL